MDRPSPWEYEVALLRRAWSRATTAHRLKLGRVMRHLFVFAVAAGVLLAMGGQTQLGDEVRWGLAIVGGVALAFVFSFIVAITREPYCLDQERIDKIESLEREVAAQAKQIEALGSKAATEREKWALNLAQLRSRGVILRNSGNKCFQSQDEFDAWDSETKAWGDEVIEAIRTMDPVKAEWFSTLDILPRPRVPLETGGPWMDRHAFSFRILDCRLDRLDQYTQKIG